MKIRKDHWKYLESNWTNSEQPIFTNSGLKDMSLKTVLEILYMRKYTPLLIVSGYDRWGFQT